MVLDNSSEIRILLIESREIQPVDCPKYGNRGDLEMMALAFRKRDSVQAACRFVKKLSVETLESRELLTASSYSTASDVDLELDYSSPGVCVATSPQRNDEAVDKLIQDIDRMEFVKSNEVESIPKDNLDKNNYRDVAFASFKDTSEEPLNLIDIATGRVREVVFYTKSESLDIDLSDPSKLFIERDSSVASSMSDADLLLNRSGGDRTVPGTLNVVTGSTSSTSLLEVNGYAPSGGSATSYFVLQIPNVPVGYQGFLEFTGTARIGIDFSINTGDSPTSNPTAYVPEPNGVTRIAVSGGSSICVFPLVDNIVEPSESIGIAFGLVQNSGGTTVGSPLSATIIDSPNSSYEYVFGGMNYQERFSWNSNRPPEDNQDEEWSNADFIAFYYRENATPLGNSPNVQNSVNLEDVGLLDDYRREMFSGDNLDLWNGFEDGLFHDVALLIRNSSPGVHHVGADAVNRDFSVGSDLYVYGNGTTSVISTVNGSFVSSVETIDNTGVSSITVTYAFNVQYSCSIRDKFEDPISLGVEFGGTPFWLTGSWTEFATYQVEFTFNRIPIPN